MKTLTLIFKNKETLTIPQKYVKSYKDKGNGNILLFFDPMLIPSNFFDDNAKVLVNHNMSTTLGVFSFCDVTDEVWNMSDCIPTEIAVGVATGKGKTANKELQIGYVDE